MCLVFITSSVCQKVWSIYIKCVFKYLVNHDYDDDLLLSEISYNYSPIYVVWLIHKVWFHFAK